jgi:hypothetical protein
MTTAEGRAVKEALPWAPRRVGAGEEPSDQGRYRE